MLADVTEFGGGRREVEKQSVVFCKNVAKPAEQTPTFANNNEQAKKKQQQGRIHFVMVTRG